MKKIVSLLAALLTTMMCVASTYTLTMADYKATTFTAGNFTLTSAIGSGATAPSFATLNDIRVYAKGTVTITCPDTLTTLVFSPRRA